MKSPVAVGHHSTYRARDVVNAPAIKARIRERSLERGDAEEITAWLANHFYRHVIGNLEAPEPAVVAINDLASLQKLPAMSRPPEWALERLRQRAAGTAAAQLWWIHPDSAPVLELEQRLAEFLATRKGTSLEGKLQRINCPQALARWTLEHLEFARKREAGVAEHQPDAVHGLLPGEHGTFVEFDRTSPNLRQEMAYESQMMGHCLGQFEDHKARRGGYGEYYADACEQGRMRLFSYRTGASQPRITVSALAQDDGTWRIDQIKGKQNRPPIERYQADVLALLNHLPFSEHLPHDALAMGIVRLPRALLQPQASAWVAVSQLQGEQQQLWLIQHHPGLIGQLELRTPLMQWLVAARKSSLDNTVIDRMAGNPVLRRSLDLARPRRLASAQEARR